MCPAVGTRFPPFGESRLELERRSVDAHEAIVREQRDDVGREIARDIPVERSRIGAKRGDQLAAAPGNDARTGAETSGGRRGTPPEKAGTEQRGRHEGAEITRATDGQSWPPRPTSWPENFCADFSTSLCRSRKVVRVTRAQRLMRWLCTGDDPPSPQGSRAAKSHHLNSLAQVSPGSRALAPAVRLRSAEVKAHGV